MLPFRPEPIAALRERLPRAVDKIYDATLYSLLPPKERPGMKPEHVFDLPSGIRFIISAESYRSYGLALHVSATVHKGTPAFAELFEQAPAMADAVERFGRTAADALSDLTGIARAELNDTFFNGHAFHWILPAGHIVALDDSPPLDWSEQ